VPVVDLRGVLLYNIKQQRLSRGFPPEILFGDRYVDKRPRGIEMSEAVQASLDNQKRIVIPPVIQKRLSLTQGMTLVVESDENGELCLRIQGESPALVDKQGVLVVRAIPDADLTEVIQRERSQRVSDLIHRARI
jgi:bifunctional DNA-binding transcriptional regulator/antitoxin component of YhaV-PrlF toxin-antitoxin module